MADDDKGLSREAARVAKTRRLNARGTIGKFQVLLQELCQYDNITDEALSRINKWLRLCVVIFTVLGVIFVVVVSGVGGAQLVSNTISTQPWIFAIPAVMVALAGCYLYWLRLQYLRRDFLNDVFHVLPPLLEDIDKIVPPKTNIRLTLDLEGICDRKVSEDVTNTADSMKRVRYIDYVDPWLKLTVELADKSEINVSIENKLTRKVTSVTRVEGGGLSMRKRHVHNDTWTNWTKQTTVKMNVVTPAGQKRDPAAVGLASWNQAAFDENQGRTRKSQTYVWNTEKDPSWEVPPNQDLARMFRDLLQVLSPTSVEI